MIQVECKICGKEFSVKPSQFKMGRGKYCSLACCRESKKKGQFINCHICGKKTWKEPKAINHSKSGNFFCSKSCQTIWRNKLYIGEKHLLWNGGRHSYRSAIVRFKIEPICKLCKTEDRRVLAVHHLDKNRKNNSKNNLIWLCHNCHHLVHIYKVKI